jgi:hypothetical protein
VGANGYDVYLGQTRFPVTPSKLEMKIKGENKTATLINDGEINFLKLPGLTEISVDFLLPMYGYAWAEYTDGFQAPDHYLSILEKLKTEGIKDPAKGTTQFIVSRMSPAGDFLFDTDIKVTVEDYSIKESADEGQDFTVSVKLKQWKDYGTKTVKVDMPTPAHPVIKVQTTRETSSAPKATRVTVNTDDETLQSVAEEQLGDSSRESLSKIKLVPDNKPFIPGTSKLNPNFSLEKSTSLEILRAGGGQP